MVFPPIGAPVLLALMGTYGLGALSSIGNTDLSPRNEERIERISAIIESTEIFQDQPGFNEDDNIKLSCGHSFHYPCISVWFRRQESCPLCRHHGRSMEKVDNSEGVCSICLEDFR